MTAQDEKQSPHTPGPWEWRGNHLVALGARLTLLRDVNFWNIEPQDKALIASAPDMLAALHAAVNWFTPPNDTRTPFPLKQIADAIAKASGQTP